MDANFPLLGASTAIKFVMAFVNTGMQEFQRLTSLSELGLSDNNISVLPPELVSIWNPFSYGVFLDIMVHKICMVQLVFNVSSEKWEISCSQLHTSLNVHLTPVLMINNSSRCDLLLNSQNFCLFNDQITKITHVFSI